MYEYDYFEPNESVGFETPDTTDNLYADAYSDIYNEIQYSFSRPSRPGQVHELKGLRHRTANHEGADALVYIPPGFDASRPIKLVIYNHGLSTDVSEAFRNSQLKQQLDKADPNTILIMPEWQAYPQTRSHAAGRFHQDGFVRNMIEEIMQKTPQLTFNSLNDVQSISIMSHSGGYNAAASELYKNGLGDKVTNITLLDSLYNGRLFDPWLRENIRDLATGRKHFNNIFSDSTSANSQAEATRVEDMLRRSGLPRTAILKDYNGRTILNPEDIQGRGIIFKRSNVRVGNRNAHNSVTNIYPELVLQS
jgi:hypothetical protein